MVITPVSDDFFMGIGCSSQVQADQYCIEKFKDDHLEISDSHSEALSSPELSDENLHGLGLPKFKLLFLKTESPLDSAGAPFLNCILKAQIEVKADEEIAFVLTDALFFSHNQNIAVIVTNVDTPVGSIGFKNLS